MPHEESPKLRRRTFIQASALAAGTALLEACGSEEIAFIEQPVARRSALKGVSVWRASTCGQCPSGCGTLVRTVDGDAKKVEGIQDHPVNHGGLCALGQASLQGLYNPDRITTPLRSVGDRGSGAFVEIGWEEALEIAAEALADASAKGSGPALLGGDGGGFQEALLHLFAEALGTAAPAFLRAPDVEVERRAAEIALGAGAPLVYDLAKTDYILSIGPAFLDRWRDPVHATWALSEMRSGRRSRRGKLVQVESRMSQTAATADQWLPVQPGREGLLARALANVLIHEKLVGGPNDSYLRLFPDPAPTPEEVAEACGIEAGHIRRLARELASVERAVVLGGGSAALQSNGLFNTVAAIGLNLLLGAVGRPGGVYESASFGLTRSMISTPATGLDDLLARLQGRGGTGSATLLIAEADPLHCQPVTEGWQAAISSVSSLICLSSFMDDTTRQADLILPVQVDVERFNASEPPSMRSTLNLSLPVVESRGESRHPGDILLALATAMDRTENLPWLSFAEMVEARVAEAQSELPGGTDAPFRGFLRSALEQGGVWSRKASAPTPPGPTKAFRGEIEPAFSDGELTLIVFESAKFGDGRGANRPWLQELPDTLSTVMWNSWAEMAPGDAKNRDIQTGDLIEVQSEHGRIQVAAILSPTARPGTIAIPQGLGYEDFGRYARGRGINPLDLLGRVKVAGTAATSFGGTKVRVGRLGRGKLAIFGRGLRDAEEIPTGWAAHIVDPKTVDSEGGSA